MIRSSVLLIAAALWTSAVLAQPEEKWIYQGQSNLYGPPVVADMHPSPGLETVVCDAEVREMICIDAKGKELWRYKGGFKKRLISCPALSDVREDGTRLLFLGNGDGNWVCVDAATGEERWKKPLGEVVWGGALWADLDGDGVQEALAGTLENGVVALDAQGNELWRYQRPEGEDPLEVRGPLAVYDCNNDGKLEIFGAGHFGPFCLNANGTLKWETITWDNYESGVVVSDARDGEGKQQVYAASRDDHALHCFEATDGKEVWRSDLLGPVGIYGGSSIAVGKIDDGLRAVCGVSAYTRSVVVCTDNGWVHCFFANGMPHWAFQTQGPSHGAASLGDVDGDGKCEVLVSSGDHRLYALDAQGNLQWSYETGLRLLYPPTLADVDGDKITDILVCGSDSRLRCLTVGGAYDPQALPWPMRQGNPSLAGVAMKEGPGSPRQPFHVSRFAHGGFEEGKTAEGLDAPAGDSEVHRRRMLEPKGWHVKTRYGAHEYLGPYPDGIPEGGWSRTQEDVLEGAYALRTEGPITIASDPVALPRGANSLWARVWVKGDAKVKVRLGHDELYVAPGESHGWLYYRGSTVLHQNEYAQLELETLEGTALWDGAQIMSYAPSQDAVKILVNQVGYDVGAPKSFLVQAEYKACPAQFWILRGDEVVETGSLETEKRIQGCYGNDWGYAYYRGDFSDFNEPGEYRIKVDHHGGTAYSYPFRIGENVLWDETAVPAYHFFYYQRCGMDIPGFHKACHLDDAIGSDGKQYELWGGWHDAGDYNTYHNAPYVLGLSQAYARMRPVFDAIDTDGNGRADFLDEILWGAEHSMRMIAPDGSAYGGISSGYGFWAAPELETDNIPGTGDERPIQGNVTGHDSGRHQAAMAKAAVFTQGDAAWVEPAVRALQWALAQGKRGIDQFSTALDLYEVTGAEEWALLAKDLFPEISANAALVDAVRTYDRLFGQDHSEALRAALTAHADHLVEMAQNPFGVLTFGDKEHPNFFKTPNDRAGWHVGTTMYLMEAAELAALAYAYTPDPRYLAFVYDQFNWTLGMNPFDLSLMEGCGDAFLPTYHNRYTFSGVKRGAVPGGIANGVTWRAVGDDRPHVDLSGVDIPDYEPNEFWLPHNTNYLKALTALRQARD